MMNPKKALNEIEVGVGVIVEIVRDIETIIKRVLEIAKDTAIRAEIETGIEISMGIGIEIETETGVGIGIETGIGIEIEIGIGIAKSTEIGTDIQTETKCRGIEIRMQKKNIHKITIVWILMGKKIPMVLIHYSILM